MKKFLLLVTFILSYFFSYAQVTSVENIGLFGTNSAPLDRIEVVRMGNDKSMIISGNLYGTLNSNYNFTWNGGYIAKIDSIGTVLWAHEMTTPGYAAYAPAISIDENNNVFVAGTCWDTLSFGSFVLPCPSGIESTYLIKFSPNGTVLWGKKITEQALIEEMVIDHSGDILMAGLTRGVSPFTTDTITSYGGGINPDVLLVKFDSLGNFIWATHAGNPGFWSDVAYDVDIDQNDNIYVGGHYRGNALFDSISLTVSTTSVFTGFAAKYSPNGTIEWARTIGTSASVDAIAADDYGNCYVGGFRVQDLNITTPSGSLSDGLFYAKLDSTGNHIWTILNDQVTTPGIYSSTVHDFVIDGDQLYSCGYFSDSLILNSNLLAISSICDPPARNTFTNCMDLDGNVIWSKAMESCLDWSVAESMDINNCSIAYGGNIRDWGTDSSAVYFEGDSIVSIERNGLFFRIDLLGCTLNCLSASAPNLTSATPVVCNGDSATIDIIGNLNNAEYWAIYTSSCGGTLIDTTTSNTFDVTATGSQTYYIQGEGGCPQTGACSQITITELPAATGSYTSDLCDGDSVIINGTTYNASNTSGTEVFLGGGSNGCDSTVNVTINVLNALDVSTSVAGIAISANLSGATYQWIDCLNGNAVISGETNQTFTATSNGEYAVIITQGGCSDTSSCVIVSTVGVNDISLDQVINVYPNPADQNVLITLGKEQDVLISIINIEGKEVYVLNHISEPEIEISLNSFSNGVYFVKVQSNNQQKVIKLVKCGNAPY